MKLSVEKLDMTFPDLDGNPIVGAPGKKMTIRDAFKVVCTAELKTDTEAGAQEVLSLKMTNFDIYIKARTPGEVEITAEEIVHLKKRAPFILSTLVLGPFIKILEEKDVYA